MSWKATYTGGYGQGSQDALDNVYQISGLLNYYNYQHGCQAGIIGNIYGESGLNPWRWQSDSYSITDPYKGYGLFQYTPAYGYINNNEVQQLPAYAPAMYSNSSISSSSFISGNPSDGEAQIVTFAENILQKWVGDCGLGLWNSPQVPGWDASQYPALYSKTQYCLSTYGNGSNVTMVQFSSCNNIEDATYMFLTCFERPASPSSYSSRVSSANYYYDHLTNDIITPGSGPTPPEPTPPTPTPTESKSKFWMYLWPF